MKFEEYLELEVSGDKRVLASEVFRLAGCFPTSREVEVKVATDLLPTKKYKVKDILRMLKEESEKRDEKLNLRNFAVCMHEPEEKIKKIFDKL